MDIVNNFGKIHSDLAELKQEYIQESTQLNNYLQLQATGMEGEKSKITDLKNKMAKKKIQVLEIVQNFRKMNSDLSNIKDEFKVGNNQEMELSMLKSQEDDTELSKVFVQESQEMNKSLKKK